MEINLSYKVEYAPRIKKDIQKLSKPIKNLIERTITTKLLKNPMHYGKPLQHSLRGQRSMRVGDYRIIYSLDAEQNIITIRTIRHRKNSYN